MRGTAGQSGDTQVLDRFGPALSALLLARRFATDTGSQKWEFAVERSVLRGFQLSDNDIRWLIRKGIVEHGREVVREESRGRSIAATMSLSFCDQSCFVLSEDGLEIAKQWSQQESAPPGVFPPESPQATHDLDPSWNPETRELLFDGIIVKKFKWRAINQEAVLGAFQDDGWPARIDDPLPPLVDLDAKRRLADTIKCLNGRQRNNLIHFRGDGTGEGVIWERVH